MNEITIDTKKIYNEVNSKNPREALKELNVVAKKKQVILELTALENKHAYICNALKCEDAKARKNASILLGNIGFSATSELITALECEQTEFVRPSLILALGKDKSGQAQEYLRKYEIKSTVSKHIEAEQNALNLARTSGEGVAELLIPKLQNQKITLMCSRGHADLTCEELDELEIDYSMHTELDDAVVLNGVGMDDLMKIRTFQEMLIIIGKCKNNPPSVTNFFSKDVFAERLQKLFDTQEPMHYRLEVKGEKVNAKVRQEFLNLVRKSIACEFLINSPGAYSFELRIMLKGELVLVFIKPSPSLDTRFTYRKNSVPASINPATAAAVMRYIYPYLKRDAYVIDPFCGTGTMLIERGFIKKYSSLNGVDIVKSTLEMARENSKHAKTNVALMHADILKFIPKREYDECICNMPFGIRVNTHESNKTLYFGFMRKLSQLLKSGGFAYLYTNDKRLLLSAIKETGDFNIIDQTIFFSGNMHPTLFILMKK